MIFQAQGIAWYDLLLNVFLIVLILEDTDDFNLQKIQGLFVKTCNEVASVPMPNVRVRGTNNHLNHDTMSMWDVDAIS